MSAGIIYALVGAALFGVGLYALIVKAHLIRKILALNVMGGGTFLMLVGVGGIGVRGVTDAVPQAMVITGIVVAVSATALALTLMIRLFRETGSAELPGERAE